MAPRHGRPRGEWPLANRSSPAQPTAGPARAGRPARGPGGGPTPTAPTAGAPGSAAGTPLGRGPGVLTALSWLAMLAVTTIAPFTRAKDDLAALDEALAVASTLGALGLVLAVSGWLRQQARARSAGTARTNHRRDPVTGLPDESEFGKELRAALQVTPRTSGQRVAVVVVGLEGVEGIRKAHGPAACDQLLGAAAQRLRRIIRDADLVARLPGYSFGAVLRDVTDVRSVNPVADRISQSLDRSFRLHTGSANITAGIGVAFGTAEHESEQLLRRAETAMNRSRTTGAVVVAESGLSPNSRMDLPLELRHLISQSDPDEQLHIDFRPAVRLADTAVTTVAASVVWRHPRHGPLDADDLISIAEANGIQTPLMMHLLTTLTSYATAWRSTGHPLVISVRLAPRCLLDPGFAATTRAALDSARVAPQMVRLEIDAAGVRVEPTLAIATLRDLRTAGVGVLLTGFEDGLDLLARQNQIPATHLRLSRTFSQELASRPEARAPVKNIVDHAHHLGLSVVADGVSDPAALTVLYELGCDHAQGPALSNPVPGIDVAAACDRAHNRAMAALTASASQTAHPAGQSEPG